jgi:hypothetical protein
MMPPLMQGGRVSPLNWKSSDLPDPEGYAAVFEKRAAKYDYAMKFAPRARDAEFMALLEHCPNLRQGSFATCLRATAIWRPISARALNISASSPLAKSSPNGRANLGRSVPE